MCFPPAQGCDGVPPQEKVSIEENATCHVFVLFSFWWLLLALLVSSLLLVVFPAGTENSSTQAIVGFAVAVLVLKSK